MSFEDICFKSEPNFKFKGIIKDKSECLASAYQYECYRDKNGEIYLISPFFDIERPELTNYHISLITLKDNKEVKKLKVIKIEFLMLDIFKILIPKMII